MSDEYQKYPRTFHLRWSKGLQSDDKLQEDLSILKNCEELIVTEKMDGECTTLYPNYLHARSIDSRHNFTRDWVKKMHSVLRHDIPKGHRLCGENLWAYHAIDYPNGHLDGYFYLFSIWDENDFCLDYDQTIEYANLLDLPMPKILYRGKWDEDLFKKLANNLDTSVVEGYVIRTVNGFHKSNFQKHLTKYVREGHVQPDSEHWLKNAKQNGCLSKNVKPIYMG